LLDIGLDSAGSGWGSVALLRTRKLIIRSHKIRKFLD